MPTHDTTHIPEGWRETTLGEVVEITSSKRIFAEEYKNSGVPFYRGKEIIEKFNGGKISTELYITEEKYHEINTKFGAPKGGDMLLTSVGTIGIPYIVRNDERFYFKDGNLTWFKNFNGILNIFLFYWLTSEYGKEEIQRHKIGSTQEALTIVGLKSISLPIPPLPEQRSIADMLSSLDAKIELLREQNETLEKTAQAIFYEWFGKYSVESPEKLPEGWRVGKIYEFLDITYGFPFKSSLFNDKEGFPLIRIRDLKDGKPQVFTPEKVDDIYKVEPGDILSGMDAEFSPVIYSGEKGLLNQRVCRFNPKDGIGKYYILEFIRPHLYFFQCTKFGTTVSHLGKSDLDSIETIIPPLELVKRFTEFSNPMYEKIVINNSQIQSLSKTRDTLLPKLMSGEVRVI